MSESTGTVRQKVIIDVDTGIDDAQAILLALSSPAVEVVAITCVNGNVRIDDVVANTLRVLQVCQRLDVPVYKGAARSLLGKVSDQDNDKRQVWTTPVDTSIVQQDHAANAIVRLVNQFPGQITLVALAPLTNVAVALALDSDLAKKLKNVVIMGGNIDARGYKTPTAEFNFWIDPEAAQVVLNSLRNILLLPYEVCFRNLLSWDFMTLWTGGRSAKSMFLRDSLESDVATLRRSARPDGYDTYDVYAMAAVVDSSVITECQLVYATVELCGRATRGQMVVDWNGVWGKDSNIAVIRGLDMAKMQTLLLSII